jgi:L-ascorbate metabolism protein UlaG (beta-lactamase superfamily)
MLRFLSVVTACLLAVPTVWSQGEKQPAKEQAKEQPPGKLTVSWHGQSFFSVTSSKGTVFVFDPHAIPEYGRIEGIKPNLIMISHNHNDHTQVSIFENIKEKGDKAPKIINGLVTGDDKRETWNIVDEKFKDLHITSVGAYHDEVQGMKHGKTAMFIVEVDGWRICHLGDLGHKLTPKQLKALGSIDALMIPCGGIYGLNGSEAQVVLNQIKPKQYVFPMHIGNARYDDLLPVDEFIDDNPCPCAIVRDGILVYNKNPRTNVQWLKVNTRESDNTLVLERHDQKRAVIVNLHYWPQANKKKKG